IRQSDFDRTASDSGEGIHARQYHTQQLEPIPIGWTTIIHDESGVRHEIDPEVHARIVESEKHLSEGNREVERQVLHEKEYSPSKDLGDSECDSGKNEERWNREAEFGHERELQRKRDLQRERETAIAAECERITRERIDTRTGSIHGVFGHGRHRDAS